MTLPDWLDSRRPAPPPGGTLCLTANTTTHLIADIAGWYGN